MVDYVTVHTNHSIDEIDPDLYGHFAEHLGRCIYGGIWVGDDDRVATHDGIRADTVELLRDLNMPVLRWPGGCFADDYHWEDGIGPREERPRRRNLWWTQGRENVPEESNAFGTDEFLRLCELVDAEPYLAANVGTGSPDEVANWVEYCNYDGDTAYANARRENGRDEPYGVAYWGVGNENWGCGGDFEPADYANEYRRFANHLRGFDRIMGGDPELELIACGHTSERWNREFLEALAEADAAHTVDHLSVHRYYSGGDAVEFDDEEYYELFARSLQLEDDIERTASLLSGFAPGDDIGVVVDEWGVWHPEAVNTNGLEQHQTVRDAVSAAGVLDVFNRHADVVTMANIAQTVNVLQCLVETDEGTAWATPTYRVFDLYEPHMGATALHTTVDTDEREVSIDEGDVPLLSASASRADDCLYVTLSNRDRDERPVAIDVGSREVAEASVLFDDRDPDEFTTSDNAADFTPETFDADVSSGGEVSLDVPGSAVVGLDVR